MDKNSIRINKINKFQSTTRFPEKEKDSNQRRNSKQKEKQFKIPEKKEEKRSENRPKSTIWELYEISQGGDQTRKAELTGSNSVQSTILLKNISVIAG